jgi:pimeloyl-ACP methyl ester carboxylesterase
MGDFVLVHGSWQGAWCWDRVAPHLEALGHRVHAVELPGARDGTPLGAVTLSRCSRAIKTVASRCERPVVVAHGVSGAALSLAAERRPEIFGRLVYLAAFLPAGSGVVLDTLGRCESGTRTVPFSLTGDGGWTIDSRAAPDLFFHDCPPDEARAMTECLVPDAVLPAVTEVAVTATRFHSVPRAYIECTRDRVVPAELQRLMCHEVPCAPVVSIDSGHSPFVSVPDVLAKELDRLA